MSQATLGRDVSTGQFSASWFLWHWADAMLGGCHPPSPRQCTPCNLAGTPGCSPAWVCILCAWFALIGVTGGEEFSWEHIVHVP